jgi:hypothetical protein
MSADLESVLGRQGMGWATVCRMRGEVIMVSGYDAGQSVVASGL